LIIRTAHISDSKAIAELSTQLGYPCCEVEIAKRLEQLAVMENCAIFVGELDDAVVAWIQVAAIQHIVAPPYAEICGLVVAEHMRGRGFGKDLLMFAEAWARERSLNTVWVWSNVVRQRAHDFYMRHGYQINKSQNAFSKKIG
jgi:GNAT superfamily N-acetyltransferase